MQPASKSEAAHANHANPNVQFTLFQSCAPHFMFENLRIPPISICPPICKMYQMSVYFSRAREKELFISSDPGE